MNVNNDFANKIMCLISSENENNKILTKGFKLVGEIFSISRIYYFETNDDKYKYINAIEWSPIGISENINIFDGVSVEAVKILINEIINKKILKYNNVKKIINPIIKEIFEKKEYHSIICIPLFVKGSFKGLLGFAQCDYNRKWNTDEIFALNTLSIICTQYIKDKAYKKEEKDWNEKILSIINDIGGISYAIETETKKIIFANKNMKRLCGKELEGEICHEVIFGKKEPCHDCNRRIINSIYAKNQRSNKSYRQCFYLKNYILKKQSGKNIQLNIGLEASANSEFEKIMIQEKERLDVTLRSIGDGVITTDKDCNILLINNVAKEIIGLHNENVLGENINKYFNIVDEYSGLKTDSPFDKVIRTGVKIELNNHTCLISSTMKEYIIEYCASPIFDNEDIIIGVVLVFRDVTEKTYLRNQFYKNQRLESLSVLAGGIAHDFNNMLSGIFGYIQLAINCKSENESIERNEYLLKTLEVFDRAKNLTQQLLTFSKGGCFRRDIVDLKSLIQKTVDFALSGSKIVAKYNIDENLKYCNCDKNQIIQCIDNIVINSKQAMDKGGYIEVIAKNIEVTDACNKNRLEKGKYIKLLIKDNGKGIEPKIIEKIFDPFFSTKETGSGLGLATVYSIIKNHDGEIVVSSEQNKGTEMTIFLPAIESVIKYENDINQKMHKNNGIALVMDDEKYNVEILSKILEKMGYDIINTFSGEETLAVINEYSNKNNTIKVAFLDLTIPGGMGGALVAEEIKEIMPETLLIASTGYHDNPVVSNPCKYGFSDYLIKPFVIDDVSKILNRIII